jgi:hypothetical protein
MQDEADEPVPEGEGEKEGDDDLLPNQSRHDAKVDGHYPGGRCVSLSHYLSFQ